MIAWYLEHYRERGAPFAVLHPFRLDFYRAMGFGYGTPVHRYRFAPGDAARRRRARRDPHAGRERSRRAVRVLRARARDTRTG